MQNSSHPSGKSHCVQNSRNLSRAPLSKAGHKFSPLEVRLLGDLHERSDVTAGEAGKQHFWKLSGHCVGVGWRLQVLIWAVCQGPFHPAGGSTPSCYAGWRACRLAPGSPLHPWSSPASSSPSHCWALRAGQGSNGQGRLPLVWTTHIPVLGSLTSMWRRSLGHSSLESTLNCSEGRNTHTSPRSSGLWACSKFPYTVSSLLMNEFHSESEFVSPVCV